ncbi:MAG TPA: sulfite exporter TauE/SafE family protein [Thermoanaerobaculia bacterium]|nr:sulfite exporter TauE/SafE family protein [Thermoanaerobaculia bacterium]
MLSVKAVLFVTLGVFAAVFIAVWAASARQLRRVGGQPGPRADGEEGERHDPAPVLGVIGFVVNFFDTLGIGSFATTTSIFKLRRLVPDRLIPGTLNVGLALPTFAQALIYISIVQVDMRTLVLMIAAAVAGAWLGAGVVAGWSRRNVQIGMGIALLFAAALMLGTQLQLFPLGGDSLGVLGVRMAIALAGNFALGALMTLGIGLYAPCMILVSLLGMNPKVAFPIMMGSCAFLMPVGGIRFIRKQSFAPRASLWLTLTGVPAVLVAAYLVRSLPLGAVRWLVVVVVVYTAGAMLWSAWTERAAPVSPTAPALDPTALP